MEEPHVDVYHGYGMTECSAAKHIIQVSKAKGHEGFYVQHVAPEGQDAPHGERGQLWLRGPCIMRGYHNRPKETSEAMEPGGWYRTGDVLLRDKTGWWKRQVNRSLACHAHLRNCFF